MPATTTRRRRRAPARRSRRNNTRNRPIRRNARGRRSTPRDSTLLTRGRAAAGEQLRGHWGDVGAIALVVLGVLCVLGLVSDLAGGLGEALADATGALLGRARVVVPIGCFVFAALLLWPAPRVAAPDADTEAVDVPEAASTRPRPTLRVAIGAMLLLLADVAILHVAYGRPAIDGPIAELRGAGGLLGAVVAAPLVGAAGVVGATVVLAGVAVVGLLVALGGTIDGLFHAAAGLVAATRDRLRGAPPASPPSTDVDVDVGDPVADEESEGVIDLVSLEPEPPLAAHDPGEPAEREPLAAAAGAVAVELPVAHPGSWQLPAADLLERGSGKQADQRAVEAGGQVLEETLAQHGVDARLIGMTVGPTVTRYELELGAGVKVNRVTGLSHDIAYAMASPDVRILAPIPGRSAIGVEVPNRQRELVTLGDVLAAPEVTAGPLPPLAVGLGRDISGKSCMLDLATLPHVLIAGATGAGKSSCINSLVTSLLMRCTPDQVRLILVDPKRVELGAYNDLPHLLTEVVTNPKKAANALDWAVREMDLRYELLAEVGVRDVIGYNSAFDRDELPTRDDPDPATGRGYERLPYIVIVVDELNDLMMVAARDVEASICRIAQMARAVGIHLVIATQRPSVDVITGVIKANVPSRMAFSVSSLADSRVILDQAGAEKLIGQGDMLLLTASSSRTQRIQGSWVDEACVRRVVAHWRRQVTTPSYVEGIAGDEHRAGGAGGDDPADSDDLLAEAMDLVVRSGLGSTSMLQRKLRVGFARAGRLMDLLERRGVVGPSEGSKARAVLMSVEELDALHARADD